MPKPPCGTSHALKAQYRLKPMAQWFIFNVFSTASFKERREAPELAGYKVSYFYVSESNLCSEIQAHLPFGGVTLLFRYPDSTVLGAAGCFTLSSSVLQTRV